MTDTPERFPQRPVVQLASVTKVYGQGDTEVRAVAGVDVTIERGDYVAIMGASGSGKSTLMNIIGCLDQPTSGHYWLDGIDIGGLNDNKLAEIRNRKLGFVFQTFNLLPRNAAFQQVTLPLIYAGIGMRERRERAKAALEAVGLGDRLNHRPNELSGGQQQRVAIARALVTQPAIILADEPTGNLDTRSGKEIMAIFRQLNDERGITIVFVTHDPGIAQQTRRIIHVRDGLVESDEAIG